MLHHQKVCTQIYQVRERKKKPIIKLTMEIIKITMILSLEGDNQDSINQFLIYHSLVFIRINSS